MRAPDRDIAERVLAEAWESGVLGVEELERADGFELIVYLASDAEASLRRALSRFADEGVSLEQSERVAPVDWVEAWKEGMVAIEISPRLVVRPSFVEHTPAVSQRVLVIDPGRAFGTGGHASTRLALEWVDALCMQKHGDSRPRLVLDVGTGSGVLALAALLLGAERAVAFDLDLDAVREAARWARYNGVDSRLQLFAGPISALSPQRAESSDCVLANLLKREVLPIADEIADAVAPGGRLVLSGLLAADRHEVVAAFVARGLVDLDVRRELDEGGDDWVAPLLERPLG